MKFILILLYILVNLNSIKCIDSRQSRKVEKNWCDLYIDLHTVDRTVDLKPFCGGYFLVLKPV